LGLKTSALKILGMKKMVKIHGHKNKSNFQDFSQQEKGWTTYAFLQSPARSVTSQHDRNGTSQKWL